MLLNRLVSTSHILAELELAALALERLSQDLLINLTNPSWTMTNKMMDSCSLASLTQLPMSPLPPIRKKNCSEDILIKTEFYIFESR